MLKYSLVRVKWQVSLSGVRLVKSYEIAQKLVVTFTSHVAPT